MARNSDVHLDVAVRHEACILHLAPTSSTTAQIAMGDAMAVALMKLRNFTSIDFARLHPGGSLGRRRHHPYPGHGCAKARGDVQASHAIQNNTL